MAEPTALALVPMRHSSERVPGKNHRLFAGRPLYRIIIDALLACELVSQVAIDTDSEVIMDDARATYGDGVHLLERPPHLRDGHTPMNQVLLNTIEAVPSEWYLQTHSTNPLLTSETIDRALRQLWSSEDHDSLFAVTRLQARLWSGSGEPINHDPQKLLRTQDLDPLFEENSNLYVFRGDQLRNSGNRIGERPLMFPIERAEAWDIDQEVDFLVAEFLYLQREDS